ncbi:sigma-70 family RNA polymerase sigma factor [Nakamurella antarctica]|nr:sigma-70 family RNA polymerase sigma factor [Nakamurella antarctica]
MTITDEATAPSDAELISRVRAGDRTAYGDLYGRHARSAATLARQISVSGAEADDLVAESFARVLDTLLDGRGPDSSFRAYLFTTVRHTAYDRSRKDKRLQFTDDVAAHEVAVEAEDPVLAQMESSFVAKAFGQLPDRWQAVLWHTQVEGQSAAEVGVLLGMSPNAVSSLAFRAREGLREAYLQVHMSETIAERCRATIDRLGAWTRGGLSKRESAQVDAHLAECNTCPALAAELSEINSGLRGLLAPLLLGAAAAGYVATLPAVPVLMQVGAHVGGTAAGSSAASGVTTLKSAGWILAQPASLGAGVAAAAAAAVVALVVVLSTNGQSPLDSLAAETIASGPVAPPLGVGTSGTGAGAAAATSSAASDSPSAATATAQSASAGSSTEPVSVATTTTASVPAVAPASVSESGLAGPDSASVPADASAAGGIVGSPVAPPSISRPTVPRVTVPRVAVPQVTVPSLPIAAANPGDTAPTTTAPTTTAPPTTAPTTTAPTTTAPTTTAPPTTAPTTTAPTTTAPPTTAPTTTAPPPLRRPHRPC